MTAAVAAELLVVGRGLPCGTRGVDARPCALGGVMQNNLCTVLETLGEWEGSTVHLEEAITIGAPWGVRSAARSQAAPSTRLASRGLSASLIRQVLLASEQAARLLL